MIRFRTWPHPVWICVGYSVSTSLESEMDFKSKCLLGGFVGAVYWYQLVLNAPQFGRLVSLCSEDVPTKWTLTSRHEHDADGAQPYTSGARTDERSAHCPVCFGRAAGGNVSMGPWLGRGRMPGLFWEAAWLPALYFLSSASSLRGIGDTLSPQTCWPSGLLPFRKSQSLWCAARVNFLRPELLYTVSSSDSPAWKWKGFGLCSDYSSIHWQKLLLILYINWGLSKFKVDNLPE